MNNSSILDVIKILQELKLLSGNNALSFLKKNEDNLLLKEILQYTYDTNYMYGIGERNFYNTYSQYCKKETKKIITETLSLEIIWEKFKKHLDKLVEQKGVKSQEIKNIITEIMIPVEQKYSNMEFSFFLSILLKDLKIGMSVDTFNKIWTDFCIDWSYMGASGITEKNWNKIEYPVIVQVKEDGMYCNAIIDFSEKTVQYISRQGKPILISGLFDSELLSFSNCLNEKMIATGEIRILNNSKTINFLEEKNKDNLKALKEIEEIKNSKTKYIPRTIGNGIVRNENKTSEINDQIRYIVWELIPYKFFMSGSYNTTTQVRFKLLCDQFKGVENRKKIGMPETRFCNSRKEIEDFFLEVREKGEEGLIIKLNNKDWRNTKSFAYKLKAKHDCDLEIIDFVEGEKTAIGTCGAVILTSLDKRVKVKCKPRTPELMKDIWNNKEEYSGKILCVEYESLIRSQDKKTYTLQHPRWIEITEKKTADSFDKIQGRKK